MAEKKAGEVEAFLSRPDTSFPTVLLYGPDAGLVSERAAKIATLSGVDLKDPFAAISLVADELEKDIGRLHDEVRTISMFGGRRLIRVRGAGTGSGKALAEAVAVFGKEPPVVRNSFAHSFDAAYDLPGGAYYYLQYSQKF